MTSKTFSSPLCIKEENCTENTKKWHKETQSFFFFSLRSSVQILIETLCSLSAQPVKPTINQEPAMIKQNHPKNLSAALCNPYVNLCAASPEKIT